MGEEFLCRALRLQCQRFDFYKAVRAQAPCPGARRKDFSGSCDALTLFFFGLPKCGVRALDELDLQLVTSERCTVGLLCRALRFLWTVSLHGGLDQGTVT